MTLSRFLPVAMVALATAAHAQNEDSLLQAAVAKDPWPRHTTTAAGIATIYQPQVDTWKGDKLTFHAAVAFAATDSGTPTFGVVFASARTETDKENRTVTLEDMKLTGAKYPSGRTACGRISRRSARRCLPPRASSRWTSCKCRCSSSPTRARSSRCP